MDNLKKAKQSKVSFKMHEMKKVHHYENDHAKYKLKEKDIKNAKVELEFQVDINDEAGTIAIGISASFFYPKPKIDLFGIKAIHTYKIHNMKRFEVEENQFRIPDPLMITLLSMAISATRGMLAALNTTPAYRKIYLPFLDAKKILDSAPRKIKPLEATQKG